MNQSVFVFELFPSIVCSLISKTIILNNHWMIKVLALIPDNNSKLQSSGKSVKFFLITSLTFLSNLITQLVQIIPVIYIYSSALKKLSN